MKTGQAPGGKTLASLARPPEKRLKVEGSWQRSPAGR